MMDALSAINFFFKMYHETIIIGTSVKVSLLEQNSKKTTQIGIIFQKWQAHLVQIWIGNRIFINDS